MSDIEQRVQRLRESLEVAVRRRRQVLERYERPATARRPKMTLAALALQMRVSKQRVHAMVTAARKEAGRA